MIEIIINDKISKKYKGEINVSVYFEYSPNNIEVVTKLPFLMFELPSWSKYDFKLYGRNNSS